MRRPYRFRRSEDVTVLVATANLRPLMRVDMEQKLGAYVLAHWLVRKHGPSARVSVFPAGVTQIVTAIAPW